MSVVVSIEDVGPCRKQLTIEVPPPAVEAETLLRTHLVCVIPEGHALAAKSVIMPKDLENEVFISLGVELAVRFLVDAAFDEAGVARKLGIDTQLSEAALCSPFPGQ